MFYHYTVALKLPDILATGKLIPSRAPTVQGERPLLWFSTNPRWERSAAKSDGTTLYTYDEHLDLLGLCRFSRRNHGPLKGYQRATRIAGTPTRMVKHLALRGRDMGADPAQWLGTVKPMPLRELAFEVCTRQDGWQPADPADFAAQWATYHPNAISARMSQWK